MRNPSLSRGRGGTILRGVRRFTAIAFVALCLFWPKNSFAQHRRVATITIKSAWGGLSFVKPQEFVIRNDAGTFRLGDRKVESVRVEALVSALDEPAEAKPDVGGLGITPAWLAEHEAHAELESHIDFDHANQAQRDLFHRSFNDAALLNTVLRDIFSGGRTDDDSSVEVAVTFEDGSSQSATAHGCFEFVLPWRFSGNGTVAFNADISRAVAALMPKKAVNRERLVGGAFDGELADAVMENIKYEWNVVDAENQVAGVLTRLRSAYVVETAEVNPFDHPEYGREPGSNQPDETNLHATLTREGFPENVTDELVLADNNGDVKGVEEFLRSGSKYESLALSVPILKDFIRWHVNVPVRIVYVHDESFGDKAMQVFAADMHAIGKDTLVLDVKAKQADIALVIIDISYFEAYWLVFPDKHMILWRYGGGSDGLIIWPADDFRVKRCSEYQPVSGGCIGAVISADGNLVK